jgi:hypothetical protein
MFFLDSGSGHHAYHQPDHDMDPHRPGAGGVGRCACVHFCVSVDAKNTAVGLSRGCLVEDAAARQAD